MTATSNWLKILSSLQLFFLFTLVEIEKNFQLVKIIFHMNKTSQKVSFSLALEHSVGHFKSCKSSTSGTTEF